MAPQNDAPRALLLAGLVVAIEGLALLVVTAVLGLATLSGGTEDLGRAGFGAVIGLAAGGWLLRIGLGLARAESWARAPAVVGQLLLLPVGYTLAFTAARAAYGVPVLALAAAVLFLLFTPEARAAFR